MTAQATAGLLAGLLLAALVVIVLLARAWREQGLVAGGAQLGLAQARADADAATQIAADVRERLADAMARVRALEDDRHARPLEGELVLVNTPRPDDQTLRGVCRRELDSGGLVLEAAVYLERAPGRGGERAREVPAGDVVVPAYSFAQIVQRTTEE